jgi:hypothetical protein
MPCEISRNSSNTLPSPSATRLNAPSNSPSCAGTVACAARSSNPSDTSRCWTPQRLVAHLVDEPPVTPGVPQRAGGVGEQGVNRCTHRYTVTWSTSTPRSASSSSMSRQERP